MGAHEHSAVASRRHDARRLQAAGTDRLGLDGEVYEAQHFPSHRRVALKVLRDKTDDSINAGRRLIDEARAVMRFATRALWWWPTWA